MRGETSIARGPSQTALALPTGIRLHIYAPLVRRESVSSQSPCLGQPLNLHTAQVRLRGTSQASGNCASCRTWSMNSLPP